MFKELPGSITKHRTSVSWNERKSKISALCTLIDDDIIAVLYKNVKDG